MQRSVPCTDAPVRASSWAGALVPALSQTVIVRLLPLIPVVLLTELCATLAHFLNPAIYKCVRNTNSSMLQEYNLSLLSLFQAHISFISVLAMPDLVLEAR